MLRAPFVLIWNLLKFLWYLLKVALFRFGHFLTRKQTKWVRLRLPRRLPFGPPAGLAAFFHDKPSYVDLRAQVKTLAEDPYIEGVVITADQMLLGPARTSDLRALLEELRRSGKGIVVHLHSVHNTEYDLATGADDVLMTPGGRFYMFGHRFEQFFAGPLLERLGVAPQFIHIGPYKTAAHRFARGDSTYAMDRMMEQLVDRLSDLREERIRQARNLSEDELTRDFERMPLEDRQALASGLIDGRIHRRFLSRWIAEKTDFVDSPAPSDKGERADEERPVPLESPAALPDGPDDAPPAQSSLRSKSDDKKSDDHRPQVRLKEGRRYADAIPRFRWTPLIRSPRTVAAVDLTGMIVMPDMELPGASPTTVDPSEVLPLLRRLTTDRTVGAVVLHINSPGGSALASEMLWDGIRRLRYEKPTIAYCSNIAASGGYYMACAADRIVCQPETLTGSIGVVAGKFSFPGVFERFDIGTTSYHRHESSAFQSVSQPLSQEAMENLRRDARSFYRQFLRRVGDARQLPRRRLHRYARGRVYIGTDAHRRALVDHLGGFDDAVTIARTIAEPTLPPSTKVSFHSHRTVGLATILKQSTAATAPFSDLLGNARFLYRLVEADPLLALMPFQYREEGSSLFSP